MKKLLYDKVAIITGGGSGIGRASAILFAEQGAKVIIANRRIEKGEESVNIIKENGGEAFFIKTDISQETDIINLISETVKKYGKLDCAFNCGGIDGVKKPLADIESNEFDEVININLRGTFLLLKYEIKQMLKQIENGNKSDYSIINMSSINSIKARYGRSPYNTSRIGINMLTKTAALEYIKKGIRINSIAPAAVNTELFQNFTNNDVQIQKIYADGHPIGRISEPNEIAESALWLCSNKSSFVIGHNLVIDGGVTL